jgi:hypothetical protein
MVYSDRALAAPVRQRFAPCTVTTEPTAMALGRRDPGADGRTEGEHVDAHGVGAASRAGGDRGRAAGPERSDESLRIDAHERRIADGEGQRRARDGVRELVFEDVGDPRGVARGEEAHELGRRHQRGERAGRGRDRHAGAGDTPVAFAVS